MGGGASLIEGIEELMTTTILIGRAISAMNFPGMFRIYDFHSKKAPRLKNAQKFTFFSNEEESDEDEENEAPPDPSQYEHFFKVVVNGDEIYIEDPLEVNESGWTALHTCCMSLSTVSAGLSLIDEIVRRGGNLDQKTIVGPGTFNKGWTPLQMACAYGVDQLVEKLIEAGADVNAKNNFGISCLLEACHRGFVDIAKLLLKSKVDIDYIPEEEEMSNSPFVRAPPQSALGEAARCGFTPIVQLLVDSGANKELKNKLGWTPLHEACFNDRIEAVRVLLLEGSDPTAKTNRGAMPYHLAGLPETRDLIKELGGDSAVPEDKDAINMLEVLMDLNLIDQTVVDEFNATDHEQRIGRPIMSGSKEMPVLIIRPAGASFSMDEDLLASNDQKESKYGAKDEYDEEDDEQPLLHSGGVLGDLPALTPSKQSPGKSHLNDIDAVLTPEHHRPTSTILGRSTSNDENMPKVSRKADDKNKKKKPKKKVNYEDVPADIPKEYLCQLTQKPMSEPMKTIYGNIYDRAAIYDWFKTQGRICPLTGAPLAEIDLTPMKELGNEIRSWLLKRSIAKSNPVETTPVRNNTNTSSAAIADSKANTGDDDLYDF